VVLYLTQPVVNRNDKSQQKAVQQYDEEAEEDHEHPLAGQQGGLSRLPVVILAASFFSFFLKEPFLYIFVSSPTPPPFF